MRKRNISFIADKLLWFIILILPLLFAMVFTCASMNNYTLSVDDVDEYISKYRPTSYGDSTYYDSFIVLDGTFNLTLKCTAVNNTLHVYTFAGTVIDLVFGDEYDISFYTTNFTYRPDENTFYSTFNLDNGDDIWSEPFSLSTLTNWSFVSYSDTFAVNNYYNFDIIFNNCILNFRAYYYMAQYLDFGEEGSLGIMGYNNAYFGLSNSISSTNIFNTYFNNLNYSLDSWFTFGERDIVYNAFNSIFGSQSNILPIFVEGSFIPKYLTYMAWIYVLHLAFDFLVFIPRLAHKWMGGVYKDEDS